MLKYIVSIVAILSIAVVTYIMFMPPSHDATEQELAQRLQKAADAFDVYEMKRVNADIDKYCFQKTGHHYGEAHRNCRDRIIERPSS